MASKPRLSKLHKPLAELFGAIGGGPVVAEKPAAPSLHTFDNYSLLIEAYDIDERALYTLLAAENDSHADDTPEQLQAWLEKFDELRHSGVSDEDLRFDPEWKNLYYYLHTEGSLPDPVREEAATPAVPPLRLVVEPKLKSAPTARLDWWDALDDTALRALPSADVEYFIQSPTPLTQFDNIMAFDAHIPGPDDAPLYQYRLYGDSIDAAVALGMTQQVPLHKFNAAQDEFRLAGQDKTARYGYGIITINGQHALVVRSVNNGVHELLSEAGLHWRGAREQRTSELSVQTHERSDATGTQTLAIVQPIPEQLAQSIARTYPMEAIEEYTSSAAFVERCWESPTLFSPPVMTQPDSKPARPALNVAAKSEPEPEYLLAVALQIYEAKFSAKQKATGDIKYTLSMRARADLTAFGDPVRSHMQKYYPTASSAAIALGKKFNLTLIENPGREVSDYSIVRAVSDKTSEQDYVRQITELTRQSFNTIRTELFVPRGERLGDQSTFRLSGGAKTNAKPRYSTPDDQALSELRASERIVSVYLMREGGKPMLVAVANARQFPKDEAHTIFQRMGFIANARDKTVAPLKLKIEGQRGVTDSNDHYTVRVPVPEALYKELLQTDQLAELHATTEKRMLREIGQLSAERVDVRAEVHQFLLKQVASGTTAKSAAQKEDPADRLAREQATLLETMEYARDHYEHFYIANILADGVTKPHAFIITPGSNAPITKPLRNVRLGNGLNYQSATTLLHSGRKESWVGLTMVPLTDDVYATLLNEDIRRRTVQPDRSSVLLNQHLRTPSGEQEPIAQDHAHALLEQWTTETAAARKSAMKATVEEDFELLPNLVAAAKDSKGGLLRVKLQPIDVLDAQIGQLEGEKLALAKQLNPVLEISKAHTLLASSLATVGMLTPDTRAADNLSGSLTQVERNAQQVMEKLQSMIDDYKNQRSIVEQYGTELPALVLRGNSSVSGHAIKKFEESIAQPACSVEGKLDPAQRVLAMHRIGLGRGKKSAKHAHLMVLTPPVWEHIEREIAGLPESIAPQTVSHQPLAYNKYLFDKVGEYYEPNHYRPPSSDLVAGYQEMGLHAIVAHERGANGHKEGQAWAEGSAGAQAHLYMVVTKANRAQALGVLQALSDMNGLDGEKQFGGLQERAPNETLLNYQERIIAIGDGKHRAAEMDQLVERALRECREGASPDNLVFAVDNLQRLLNEPRDALAGGLDDALETLFDEDIYPRVRERIETIATNPAVQKFLAHIQDHHALPEDAALNEQAIAALERMPSIRTALRQQGEALGEQFDQYLIDHPAVAAALPEDTNIWSLHLDEGFKITEAVATHTAPRLTVIQGGEHEIVPWQNTADAYRDLKALLQERTAEQPVIITCPLTEQAEQMLEPLRKTLRNGYKQRAREDALNPEQTLGVNAVKSASFLTEAGSSNSAKLRGQTVLQLQRYFGLVEREAVIER